VQSDIKDSWCHNLPWFIPEISLASYHTIWHATIISDRKITWCTHVLCHCPFTAKLVGHMFLNSEVYVCRPSITFWTLRQLLHLEQHMLAGGKSVLWWLCPSLHSSAVHWLLRSFPLREPPDCSQSGLIVSSDVQSLVPAAVEKSAAWKVLSLLSNDRLGHKVSKSWHLYCMRIAVRENTTRPQLYKYVSKGTEDTASILETLFLPFRDN